MKILITGANGFIGKNLISTLETKGYTDLMKFDIDTPIELLDGYTKEAEFIFHLAGVNRPENNDEFMEGNFGFTSVLLDHLKKHQNTAPIMISSSIQAEQDNLYGASKKAGEDLLFAYGVETGAKVLVYRFENVFGKWCRPNYNSVIATFCHNVANNEPIKVNDPSAPLSLIYVDDLVKEIIRALSGQENRIDNFCYVKPVHHVTLGHIVDLIHSFKSSRDTRSIPSTQDPFTKKLYATYLSYLAIDNFSYPLQTHSDHRGSFTEIIKTLDRGQVSVNISKPGVTKGNHWHHTKNEKFLVVSGYGEINFRQVFSEEIITYKVSEDRLEVVDIPTGYTHNIVNTGDKDLVTIMWANEIFDPEDEDVIFLEV